MADQKKPTPRKYPDSEDDSERADIKRLRMMAEDARATPAYEQLMGYLGLRRAVPVIEQTNFRNGTRGEFERNTIFGDELPPAGRIRIDRGAASTTLVHELTHAAVQQLMSQYEERPNSWGRPDKPTQFTDALEKILIGSKQEFKEGKEFPPGRLAETLDPQWAKEEKGYRASNSELPAFAVGHMSPPPGMVMRSAAPKHLEPTLATQVLMLIDLASKELQTKPQSQGR